MALALLVVSLFLPAATQAQERSAQLTIRSIDSSRYPEVAMEVNVRDNAGVGVSNLGVADFRVEENGRLLPGESLQVKPIAEVNPAFTVAIVLDLSTLLREQAIAQIRADTRALLEQLLGSAGGAVEVGMFVPRGSDANQALLTVPFSPERAELERALESVQPRNGRTDMYNTVAAAVSATADRAAQRNVPAHVIVLSDGQDRTSIVGSGASGANEVARLAEERRVTVSTFGYGGGLRNGSTALTQVADRTGGSYTPDPQPKDVAQMATQLREQASGGLYQLSYRTSLPADGREQPISVQVATTGLELRTAATVLLPKPWEPQVARQLTLQTDARQYPEIVAVTRPVNNLRRTVPNLGVGNFSAALGGTDLGKPTSMTVEPLDRSDPAAAQSVALVVEQSGPNARALREMAITFLQTPSSVPSRVALFVPGFSTDKTFTHDHNAVINDLNQAAVSSPSGDPGATLLSAIDAAASDGDTARRPAYVVWLADSEPDPAVRARALTQARNQGVTVHVITATNGGAAFDQFAATTEGVSLAAPDSNALAALANQIAADRATRYRLTFRSPLLADGENRLLTVTVGQQRANAEIKPFIGGNAVVRAPLAPAAQLALALLAGCGLLAVVIVPRMVRDRKLRCPQCGYVKRASWGTSCLFCEYDAASKAGTSAPLEVPLAGFAQQGAALVEDVRATPHTPASRPLSVPLHAEPEPAPMAEASANGIEPTPTAFDLAQSQRHTDFWGALPGEPAYAAPAAEAEPAGAPHTPPDLPVFATNRHAEEQTGSFEPSQGRELSHTDFWGPPVEVQSEEFRMQSDVEQSALPVGEEDAARSTQHAARSTQHAEAPASTSFGEGDEAPAHTGFWGAASDAAAPPPAPKPAPQDEPDPAANTDFWGPVKR